MKKGFTLIELLAIVILLAIISLIATPIILNVVNDAQESADMSSALLIMNSGHNYYASSLLDETKKEKIDNNLDIYRDVAIINKPTTGELYVNNHNQVAMAVVINNKCYKKTFVSDIEITTVDTCDLGYTQPDNISPTISQEVINATINHNGWYQNDIYIKINVIDNESGAAGYKRCMSNTECEPDDTIYSDSSQIYLNSESASNYVCIIGVDNYGNESEKSCVVYKIDKTAPTIDNVGDLIVQLNDTVDLSSNVTYTDALSGIDGTLTIIPTSIDTSTIGTKQVTYKVQDQAGNVREVVRNIIVDADAPTVTFSPVDNSVINENGWAKDNFYLRATITDNSGSGLQSAKSCTTNSSSECEPIAEFTETTKDFYIETEGSNRACIEVTDNNNKTTKICSDTYNLDKTAPTAGTANFTGTLGTNDWYTTDVTVDIIDGSDNLSGHSSTTSNITSITTNTGGTTVTITTTDLAGNSSSRDYTIKIDKDSPTLTAKDGVVEITKGDSNDVSNYFNIGYSTSNGTINCTPSNTNSLDIGTHTLSCTVTGGNGKTAAATKEITVKVTTGPIKDVVLSNFPELDTDGNGCTNPSDNNYSYMGGCYIKGTANDNYLWYSGFLWRIMGITAEGNVKMITDETVTTISYHDSSSNYDNSYVKQWLNDNFYNSLKDNSIINSQTWCSETTTDDTVIRNTCSSSTSAANVGLLTIDEYNLAGADNSYLNIRQYQWTMTPYSSSNVWLIFNSGSPHRESSDFVEGVRPVVVINANANITGGNGTVGQTWNNTTGPYLLNEDKSIEVTGKLNEQATSGEYVLFAGKKYRVVGQDSSGNTKLILDGYYEENSEIFEIEYGSSNTFSTSSGIGQKLNTDVLNWLAPTTTDRNKLVNATWYQNEFDWGYSHSVSLNETSPNRTITATVGLIRIGEMLSGHSSSLLTNNYTSASNYRNVTSYWTMNSYNILSSDWLVFDTGNVDNQTYDTPFGIRPVIVINSSVNITSGTGTWANPYQI